MARTFRDDESLEDVRVGDVVVFMRTPHVITRIEPYEPQAFPGEKWCIAYADEGRAKPWGISISSGKGFV